MVKKRLALTGLVFSMAFAVIVLSLYFTSKIYISQKQQYLPLLQLSVARIKEVILSDAQYVSYQMEYISNRIKEEGSDHNTIEQILSAFNIYGKIDMAISWNVFSWVDLSKHLVVDTEGGILDKPKDMSGRDYLPYTIKTPGQFYLGKPVFGAYSGQWMIPGGMGVVDKNNKYVGSIVWGFDIDKLTEKLKLVNQDIEGVNFAIVNGDNEVIVRSTPYNGLEEDPLTKILNSGALFNDDKSVLDKGYSYVYYRKLDVEYFDNLNLGVIAFYDDDAIRRNLLNLWVPRVIEFIIVMTLVIFLILLLNRKLLKPIFALSRITEDIINNNKIVEFSDKSSQEMDDLFERLKLIDRYKNIARRSSLSKSSFFASVSNELRSPITSIIAVIELLLYDYDNFSKEEKKELLQDVQSYANESLQFISDLIDVANSGNNFELKNVTNNDLVNLIDRSIKITRGMASRSAIEIKVDVKNRPLIFKCDSHIVKQILVNLLTYAIKHSGHDTKISISAKKIDEDGKNVEIIVKDQGFGMDEDVIKDILGHQTISAVTKKIDLFGIGLPLVKYLIDQHKGFFDIKSEIGKGNKFIIKL